LGLLPLQLRLKTNALIIREIEINQERKGLNTMMLGILRTKGSQEDALLPLQNYKPFLLANSLLLKPTYDSD